MFSEIDSTNNEEYNTGKNRRGKKARKINSANYVKIGKRKGPTKPKSSKPKKSIVKM
jgi:hypothetical protein